MKNLHDYLQASGVLKSGDEGKIAKAKDDYRKLYRKQYHQEYIKTKKSVSVTFTKSDYKKIIVKAKVFDLTIPQYIKQIVLEKLGKQMQPYPNQYAELLVQLGTYQQQIREMQKGSQGYITIYRSYEVVIKQVEKLRTKLLGL